MSMMNIICPKCGGQAQIEAGRSVMCPYCAYELNTAAADQGFAFAEDAQFAKAMQTAKEIDFAQQPVREMQPAQTDFFGAPVQQMQQPYAAPQMNPAQFAQQQMNPAQFVAPPQYSPAELAAAKKKRGQWYILNAALYAIPAIVLAIGIMLEEFDGDAGVPLILSWLCAHPIGGFLSGLLRPDDAYIDKKPLFKHKSMQGFMHFIASFPATAAAGGILYAILESFSNIF